MADKNPAKGARAADKSNAFRDYEERFTATPDPWGEIVRLDHGTDRTFGSTVRAMVMNAEPAQRPAMETKLLAVLARTEATAVAQLFACRMLALIGSAKAVPALTALLADAKTADAARYALDALDDPAAADALRGALEKLTGPAKAGLIGAIALRGDAQAVPALVAIKARASEPAVVRTAATRALERLQAKA